MLKYYFSPAKPASDPETQTNITIHTLYSQNIYSLTKKGCKNQYSQTYIRRPPLEQLKSGCLGQLIIL